MDKIHLWLALLVAVPSAIASALQVYDRCTKRGKRSE